MGGLGVFGRRGGFCRGGFCRGVRRRDAVAPSWASPPVGRCPWLGRRGAEGESPLGLGEGLEFEAEGEFFGDLGGAFEVDGAGA